MKLLALALQIIICFNFATLDNLMDEPLTLPDFNCANKLECLQGQSLLLIDFATLKQNPAFNLMKMKKIHRLKDTMQNFGTRAMDGRIRMTKRTKH